VALPPRWPPRDASDRARGNPLVEPLFLDLCLNTEQPVGQADTWEVCTGATEEQGAKKSGGSRRNSGGGGAFERWERGPRTLGPARQVSASPFVVVTGTGGGSVGPGSRVLEAVAVYVASLHAMAADTHAPVASDLTMNLDHPSSLIHPGGASKKRKLSGRNAIVIGRPDQNAFLARIHPSESLSSGSRGARSAVHWAQARNASGGGAYFWIEGAPCPAFIEPGTAIVYLAPWWDDRQSRDDDLQGSGSGSGGGDDGSGDGAARLLLVVAGVDERGLLLAAKLARPTIPPMTRAPFTNLLPDWIVLGSEAETKGYGGVRAAGFWGNNWEFDPASSYLNC